MSENVQELAQAVADEVIKALAIERDERPLLRLREVGERLGISERAVRSLVNGEHGKPPKLPSVVIGDGARRVEQSALDAYLEERRQAA